MRDAAAAAWLAVLVPIAGSAAIALGLAGTPRRARVASVSAVSLALIASAVSAADVWRTGVATSGTLLWLALGNTPITLALRLDRFATLALVLVATVALLVTLYALAYLRGDARERRFHAVWLLFIGGMLLLVAADDAILFFAAWETLGLASYLLIGYWFERSSVPRAATQAFLVTRVGDLALLAGLLLLIRATGTTSLGDAISFLSSADAAGALVSAPEAAASGTLATSLPTLRAAALLILTGAAAKSAQLPFSAWLPDAMLGPTPVSALLHSATMVAAGVYLVARLSPLMSATGLLSIIAWVGAATALYGAAAALAQRDLKRLLAYSTMSQLGLMFVALGAGSPAAAIALLVAQALFKSLLFLAAGAVQEEARTLDLARMGGLARRMPRTALLFAVAALALAGIPVAIALPAKDAVLAAAAGRPPALLAVSLLASALTAAYIARAAVLAFAGEPRSDDARAARDPGGWMLAPMLALAALLVLASPGAPALGAPVAGGFGVELPERAVVTAAALALAVLGIGAGTAMARGRWSAARESSGSMVRSAVGQEVPLSTGGGQPPRTVGEYHAPHTAAWHSFTRAAELGFGLPRLYASIAASGIALARVMRAADDASFAAAAPALATSIRALATRARHFDANRVGVVANRLAVLVLALVGRGTRFDTARLDAGLDRGAAALGRFAQRSRTVETGRVYNYMLAVALWSAGVLAVAGLIAVIRTVGF